MIESGFEPSTSFEFKRVGKEFKAEAKENIKVLIERVELK
jgi:hypothetical protein